MRHIETLPDNAWIRTCTECGNKQEDKNPMFELSKMSTLTNSYCNRKCKKCKSESLDYGTENYSCDDWFTNDPS